MPLIFWTAEGIAKMIREDVPFEQSDIPKNFKDYGRTVKEGYRAASLVMLSFRLPV